MHIFSTHTTHVKFLLEMEGNKQKVDQTALYIWNFIGLFVLPMIFIHDWKIYKHLAALILYKQN